MNIQKIKQLIARYEQGETSLDEELYLKSVFTGKDEIPFELRHYRAIFGHYKNKGNQEQLSAGFDDRLLETLNASSSKPHKLIPFNKSFAYLAIAASFILLFGMYFGGLFDTKTVDTYNDPRLAYAETKKILMEISGNLNTGFAELHKIEELNVGMNTLEPLTNFDEGMKNFRKISVMNQSQKIITHENK